VQPLPHEPVVVKHRITAFFGPDLERLLRAHDIDTLVLWGTRRAGLFCRRYAIPTVCSLEIPLEYCHINSFQREPSVARPERGGEKRTAMWASHHEELCSDGVVSPHVCDPMVVPHRWVVREWCNPVGQPWMLVVTLPSVHDGLRVLLMAVLWTFRRLSMGRPAHRQLTRNALLDLTTIIPATTCHQRNYVEAYSRSTRTPKISPAACKFFGFSRRTLFNYITAQKAISA